jgi:hypothetical protein
VLAEVFEFGLFGEVQLAVLRHGFGYVVDLGFGDKAG